MSAQKNTLAALLAAAVIVTPSAIEAKPGKDRGAQGAGPEHKRGGGEARGGGNKHREAQQAPQASHRSAPAPRQAFEGRGRGDKRSEARPAFAARERDKGKHARQERTARAERFAVEPRQRQEAAKPKRWERERRPERALRAASEARPDRGRRESASFVVDERRDRSPRASRKVEKQAARQQRAAYRAEVKQQRQWSRHQRQALSRAAAIAPVVAYQPPFADYARDVSYAYQPAYRAPAIRTFSSYPSYAPAYAYAPQYSREEAYGYGGRSYPQGYGQWSGYPAYSGYPSYAGYSAYSGYAPYDAGYGNAGLGGLFGGGGGIGDILVALLPLLLGDGLGLGGLTGGAFDTGLLGGSMPSFADGYGAGDYAGTQYADPGFAYRDASLGQDMLGADQGLLGGDGLMTLLPLALQSGLFGDGLGSFGGLSGLGGGLGPENALGFSNPGFGYAAPYAADTGLLNAFGV